jgi:prepilin-type N-terminal cleavage/methylation domain-containing protein
MRATNSDPVRDHRATGFTLIELMVVMLLISIILAVAIPRFEGGMFQDPTKIVSRRLIYTVRALRSHAVQRQMLQSLIIDLDNQRFWVAAAVPEEPAESEESAAAEKPAAAAATEKAFDLPKSIRFVAIQFPHRAPITSGKVEIFFYPAGYSDHVVVHMQNDNQERFSYVVEPLLPKVKLLEEWIDL